MPWWNKVFGLCFSPRCILWTMLTTSQSNQSRTSHVCNSLCTEPQCLMLHMLFWKINAVNDFWSSHLFLLRLCFTAAAQESYSSDILTGSLSLTRRTNKTVCFELDIKNEIITRNYMFRIKITLCLWMQCKTCVNFWSLPGSDMNDQCIYVNVSDTSLIIH